MVAKDRKKPAESTYTRTPLPRRIIYRYRFLTPRALLDLPLIDAPLIDYHTGHLQTPLLAVTADRLSAFFITP